MVDPWAVIKETEKQQHAYDNSVSEEKLRAKEEGCSLFMRNLKGDRILDLGGENYYHKFLKGNIKIWNLPDSIHQIEGGYDGVIAMHILEHSPFPLMVLKEVYEHLVSGGIFYMAVPETDEFIISHFPDHYSVLPRAGWRKLIKEAGFNILIETEGTFTHYWKEYRFICKKL